MHIEQIYTGCLAQGAYFIESNGEVAIIDPLREVTPYMRKAEAANAKIKYIFETHFHADFVSGHVTLSKETGAPIVFGPTANPSFEAIIAEDGAEFKLGDLTIKVLHTPGHTMESTCYLLRDKDGKDHALFSGDTLFLGDVGRPDLAQKAANMTKEDLAGILFDSLRQKIMPLADEVIIYPAHGAGSACGKHMMKETVDTLGNQKKINYALRENMTKSEFVAEVTEGLLPPPQYFPLNVKMNKEGYEDIAKVLQRGTKALAPDAFERTANDTNALVLDVRHQDDFVKGHIPRSIFIGLNGDFAPWVGALISDSEQPIVLVAPYGKEEEAITRLSRVGYDGTIGYLEGGFDAWKKAGKEYDTVNSVSSDAVKIGAQAENPNLFDVRKTAEYEAEHLKEAQNTPLDTLNDSMNEFPIDYDFYVHCAGGYRSVIAASILKSRGIHNLINIEGGFPALKQSGFMVLSKECSNL
ncbi:rhodanese-like domain-containing protein [Arenibacter sp. GZD96]|uniref:MBL fold metallo-hydrolase n=1 Tax=Aurantibrevibacter litoralis TaxID=3106030 RepID=UPI002B003AD2|nr:rhodanese-like domain-containing protein [Arenibacter sp. GZD-96]MEA1785828.1 rhodanese-like domain-containing protein [Arenibacter sp. GZD-96]